MFRSFLVSVGKSHPSTRITYIRRILNEPYHRLASTSASRTGTTTIWTSLIPKILRGKSSGVHVSTKPHGSHKWNPATFFIVIFLVIGSNAIQMIALRNNHYAFSRKADARIRLLKEVIERVKQGENLEVESLLGTGDEERELEWSRVVEELIASDGQLSPEDNLSQNYREGSNSKPASEYEASGEPQQEHTTSQKSSKVGALYTSDNRFF